MPESSVESSADSPSALPSSALATPTPPADSPAWSNDLLDSPHTVADKRRRVRDMFAAIAPSYDLNNRLHSFGRDRAWRRAAVKIAEVKWNDVVVDVACGTGDLTIAFLREMERKHPEQGRWPGELGDQVFGIDFTFEMLPIARQKLGAEPFDAPHYLNGDAQQLPLPDACCDVVSIAFGIRNVQNVDAALAEFYRVLRPGGRVIVLEFSEPTNPVIRTLNRFYTGQVMPRTATWISRDKSGAYAYLPKSVKTFMTREQMAKHLADAGFTAITQKPMTFGVCVAYRGVKN